MNKLTDRQLVQLTDLIEWEPPEGIRHSVGFQPHARRLIVSLSAGRLTGSVTVKDQPLGLVFMELDAACMAMLDEWAVYEASHPPRVGKGNAPRGIDTRRMGRDE